MRWARFLFGLLLGRRSPIVRGTLDVPGLIATVRIRRDGWGVPHIDAAHARDAWFGLGFCQGQDRAFQLEASVRLVHGTLAEAFGPAVLPADRLARRVGFAAAARQQLAALDPDIRETVEAFAAGVNAGRRLGARRRAHEFALLRLRPTPWTGADVLGLLKVMAFGQTMNWDAELGRLLLLRSDGPAALADLDPAAPVREAAAAGAALEQLAGDAAALRALLPAGGGSNCWAVAPARARGGRAILASDPHLPPALPPYWYLAHVRTPAWALAGAAFVGGPVFPTGHNGHAAWGITNGMTDAADLFLEEVGPDGRSVRDGDAFAPCAVRRERIRVRGAPEVVEDVLVTPRGPIVGPALAGEAGAVSLRAVWLDPLPLRGLFALHAVRSFAEFRGALAAWPTLPLAMGYADATGTIGWQLAGQPPRRRAGSGALPLAGRDPANGWEDGLLSAEALPHEADPARGFVALANQRLVPDGAGPTLGADWLDCYRADRIAEALGGRADWDAASTAALQQDVASLPWREVRAAVLAAPAADPRARRALDLLRAWDGEVAATSGAAAVFELFLAELARRAARARAPRGYRWLLGRGVQPLAAESTFAVRWVGRVVRLLREQPRGWFDRGWPETIAAALAAAVGRLERRRGPDPAAWAWGRVRPLTLRHPLGERPPLDRVFNLGPIPWGGDTETVARGAVSPLAPTANPTTVASLRAVIELGAWDRARFALPGGQSGNPCSRHYADQFPRWRAGAGVPIPWSEGAVAAATQSTLLLRPRRDDGRGAPARGATRMGIGGVAAIAEPFPAGRPAGRAVTAAGRRSQRRARPPPGARHRQGATESEEGKRAHWPVALHSRWPIRQAVLER